MSDEYLHPLNPDEDARPGQNGSLPAELAPLDDLLWRDGALWRSTMPSERRLAQLARQLATYTGAATLPSPDPSDDPDGLEDELVEPPDSSASLHPRPSRQATRWRALGAVAAAVVIVGLLATLLHSLAGSRGVGTSPLLLTGDCSQAASTAARSSQVNWPQFGFGASGGRCNPYESRLSPATVQKLKLAWNAPGQFIDSSPAVVAGRIYVASIAPDSALYAFDARSGKRLWTAHDGLQVETNAPSPAVSDGLVIINVNKSLLAFDATSGKHIWTFTASGDIQTPPAIFDGVAYVGVNPDGRFYAINIHTGQKIWEKRLATAPAVGSVAVTSASVYVTAGPLYALNRATGAIRWSQPASGSVLTNQPVVSDGIIYVADIAFHIHAYAADTGALRWVSKSFTNTIASAVGMARSHLFVGDMGGAFRMLDARSGETQWSVSLPDDTLTTASPAIANGVVYVTSACDCGAGSQHFIVALRASDGRLLWQFAPGYPVYSSPVVANGFLYVATYDGLDAFTLL